MFGGELANDEGEESDDAAEGFDANIARGEPILALSGVEKNLERAEAEGEQADADEVYAGVALAPDVGGIVDEARHHHEREDAHGNVEVENPAPGVIVGDPAAEGRADDGCDDDSEGIGGHRLAVFLLGKALEEDGLGEGLESASGDTLEHSKDDQLRKRGGRAAEQRS